jgi:hypothetical protein
MNIESSSTRRHLVTLGWSECGCWYVEGTLGTRFPHQTVVSRHAGVDTGGAVGGGGSRSAKIWSRVTFFARRACRSGAMALVVGGVAMVGVVWSSPCSRCRIRVRRSPGLREAFAQNLSGGEFVADLGQLRVAVDERMALRRTPLPSFAASCAAVSPANSCPRSPTCRSAGCRSASTSLRVIRMPMIAGRNRRGPWSV